MPKGGYYFMNLTTSQHLNHNHWTALPMPQDVINCIHVLAHHQGAAASLTFTDCYGIPCDPYDFNSNDDDESSYSPSATDFTTDSDDSDDLADDVSDTDTVPDLAAAADNITGVANNNEHINLAGVDDNVDDNINHDADIAGVDDNVNHDAKIAGMGANC